MQKSKRWKKLEAAGAKLQRLLWASTGTKDPEAPDVLYIEALAAPDTINTMPSETLKAFASHGKIEKLMPEGGGKSEKVLREFQKSGVDLEALAADLQKMGAEAFEKSWNDLLSAIESKGNLIGKSVSEEKKIKKVHQQKVTH
jgi:transaldolase